MQITTKAIVLSSLKYGDTSLIVRAFTQSDGVKSYLLKGVLASKKAKIRPAYFLPLMQLEIVANHKNKGTLESIRDVRVAFPYQTMHTDVVKNSVVLFLAEMLGNSIQEQEQDEGLFNYLEYALHWMDAHKLSPNFHILFLLNLTKYLGFYPDTSYQNSPFFDLLEGRFCNEPSLNPLIQNENLENFKKFLGTNFEALQGIQLTKSNRRELLKTVVQYFRLHVYGFREPKSLAVLNAVFT
ncbi:DNA repair protein RecO [Flagellimonas halotolerans]|uniref:DNA repair protein RecO n=1 Tax=Flagellimonas halotolerans TaxID=3112164 RepID=A0ABU6ITV1_9FLAO|nr:MULTISPECIES: DNA repair protein RecO [unclassified Allomuricauda]MEC3966637.1 DNA repair protein RecO [Muricauda sp. SYSU M86414]MEC4266557.1 DNA repair protein RecO [Muricauda sp. SYSU M84420]